MTSVRRWQEDRVGRFGGEEFVVLLPGAGQQTVAEIAERIRLLLRRRRMAAEARVPEFGGGVAGRPAADPRRHPRHHAAPAALLHKQMRKAAGRDVKTGLASAALGRFGGEEFVVPLPDACLPAVSEVPERIRHTIASLEIPIADRDRPLQVTASVGAALHPQDGQTLSELLEEADRALYAAKHAGRDQVRFPVDAAAPDTIPAASAPVLDAAPPHEAAAA